MSELDHIIRTVPFEQLLALVVTLRLLAEIGSDSVPSVSELRLGSVAKTPNCGRAA